MPFVITDKRSVQELLAERRRTGASLWDEVWDGMVHMSPVPSVKHQRIERELLYALHALFQQAGMGEMFHSKVGQIVLEMAPPQAIELQTVPLILQTVKKERGLRIAVSHRVDLDGDRSFDQPETPYHHHR